MVRVSIRTRGALQIQDRSPQSRPVASRNQSQTHSDATGLSCGDRSWICNAPKMGGELRPILLLQPVIYTRPPDRVVCRVPRYPMINL